jgi:hypothetical protein
MWRSEERRVWSAWFQASDKNKTLALARRLEQKWLENAANIGASGIKNGQ